VTSDNPLYVRIIARHRHNRVMSEWRRIIGLCIASQSTPVCGHCIRHRLAGVNLLNDVVALAAVQLCFSNSAVGHDQRHSWERYSLLFSTAKRKKLIPEIHAVQEMTEKLICCNCISKTLIRTKAIKPIVKHMHTYIVSACTNAKIRSKQILG